NFSKTFICSVCREIATDRLPSFVGLGSTKLKPSYAIPPGPMKMGRPHPKSASWIGSLTQLVIPRLGHRKVWAPRTSARRSGFERRPQVLVIHAGQGVVDLARRVPYGPRLQLPRRGQGCGRKYHVSEVPPGQGRLEPGPPIGRDVELRLLVGGQAAGPAGRAPHVAGQHLVGAVRDRVAVLLRLGLEGRELLARQFEYGDAGLGRRGIFGIFCQGFHGGRWLVLDMLELGLGRVAGPEEGPVDEGGDGEIQPAGHVGPRVDEVEAREAVRRMRIRRDPLRVVHRRDQPPELQSRREVAVIRHGAVGLGLHKQHALGVAVDLDPAVLIPPQPPGHGVERHQGAAERRLEHGGVEEVLRAGGEVEVDAGRVEVGDHQVDVRVPQAAGRRRRRRSDHGRGLNVDLHGRTKLEKRIKCLMRGRRRVVNHGGDSGGGLIDNLKFGRSLYKFGGLTNHA
ncbi:hypothetical protein STAS_31673, partial [Striga asiatica]